MSWTIDAAHSRVGFNVTPMMISRVRGEFESFSGTVEFDEANPAATTVTVDVDVNSINTRVADRDNHLRSADFFNVSEQPVMSFRSTKVELTGGNTAKMTGDLSIRGVTKPVVLDVEYSGLAKSPWGTTSAGFSATGVIRRTEWGLTWNAPLETGGLLVGEDVTITLEVELVRQEAPEAVALA